MVENIVFTVFFLAVVCLVSICCAVHSKTEKRNEKNERRNERNEKEKKKTFIDLHWQSWICLVHIHIYCQKQKFPLQHFFEELKQSKYCFSSTVAGEGIWWIGTKEEMEKAEEKINERKEKEEKRLQKSLSKTLDKSM
jgi:hypothetical protein